MKSQDQAVVSITRRHLAPLLAFALGSLVVLLARWGPDWPAQEFRAWVAARHGLVAWTDRWYSGQSLPGYSVLYPVFAVVLGAAGTGLFATVCIAWACSAWAPTSARRAVAYHIAVATSVSVSLLIGQVPFLLGAAFGVLAMRLIVHPDAARFRLAAGAAAAAASSLASPLAGAFLLVLAPAVWVIVRRRSATLLPAVVGPVVSLVSGGGQGPFPFQWQTLACVLAFCVGTAWYCRRYRFWLAFAVSYALLAVAVDLVPNSLGGNVDRLGKIAAVPLACRLLYVGAAATGRFRVRVLAERVLAASVLVLAIWWPAAPFISSIQRGADDPSQYARYYAGLLAFVAHHPYASDRIEVPFTREHWEALYVARDFPIARGWERQTDLEFNAVLYKTMSAGQYAGWLHTNAVAYVALPDVPLDYGGLSEAQVIGGRPSFLQPVWHDSHWTLWRVRNARPLVGGPAHLTHLGPTELDVTFAAAGQAVVRLRGDTRWDVVGGAGCTGDTSSGWLAVTAYRPGLLRLRPSALDGRDSNADCD